MRSPLSRCEDPPPVFGGKEQIREAICKRERLYGIARDVLYGHYLRDDIENTIDEELTPHDRRELIMCVNTHHLGVSSQPVFAKRDMDAMAKVGSNNYRAKRLGLDFCLTEHEWANILEEFGNQCAYCGGGDDDPQMDHLVALSSNGGTEKWNVVPSCAACNSSKRCKDPAFWLGKEKLAEIQTRLRKANP